VQYILHPVSFLHISGRRQKQRLRLKFSVNHTVYIICIKPVAVDRQTASGAARTRLPASGGSHVFIIIYTVGERNFKRSFNSFQDTFISIVRLILIFRSETRPPSQMMLWQQPFGRMERDITMFREEQLRAAGDVHAAKEEVGAAGETHLEKQQSVIGESGLPHK
jgi:hypothetical protein